MWSPTFYVDRDLVAAMALNTKLPTIGSFSTERDLLMSYGASAADAWKRVGYYIDRLLKGTKPSELPVEQIGKFKLTVNLKNAKALGVNIPNRSFCERMR